MPVPRLRQAVIVARDLESTAQRLQEELGLGEPYRDPAVGHFGLVNAVFAIGDTFLEVVSPIDVGIPGARTAAAQLRRCGDEACGYMAMLQIDSIAAARERIRKASVRVVFGLDLEDISEVHLHPADMRGAIVALSEPRPAETWPWGGAHWADRTIPGRISGLTVAVNDPVAVAERWRAVAGGPVHGIRFVAKTEAGSPDGITAIDVELDERQKTLTFTGHDGVQGFWSGL